jgi:hypothetical protein
MPHRATLISSASHILYPPSRRSFSPGHVVYSLILSRARSQASAPLCAKCGSQMRSATLYAPRLLASQMTYSGSSGACHNKYAINRTDGVQESIMPKNTACKVVIKLSLPRRCPFEISAPDHVGCRQALLQIQRSLTNSAYRSRRAGRVAPTVPGGKPLEAPRKN